MSEAVLGNRAEYVTNARKKLKSYLHLGIAPSLGITFLTFNYEATSLANVQKNYSSKFLKLFPLDTATHLAAPN